MRNCPSGFANCSEPTAASNDVATLSFENDNRTQPELRPVVCNSGFTPTCPSNMGYLIGVQALAPATTIEIVAVTVSTSQPLKIWTNELYVNIDAPSKGQGLVGRGNEAGGTRWARAEPRLYAAAGTCLNQL